MWFWLGGATPGAAADDSAELLTRMRLVTRRPKNDRALTDQMAYVWLTEAQRALIYELAAHIPDILKGAPEKMNSLDGGLTYSTVAGEPLGHMEIYAAPYTEPLVEGPLWASASDYTREGARTIRMGGNMARTFADGPYARYVVKPGVIDQTKQPTIQPVDLRRVLPWKAAVMWAEAGGTYDPKPYRKMVQELLWGDPELPGSVGIIQSYKVQHFSSGLLSSPDGGLWYRSRDLT